MNALEQSPLEKALIDFGKELLLHRLQRPAEKFTVKDIPLAMKNAYDALKIDCEDLTAENRVQLIFQALTDPQAPNPTLLPITELSLSALENPPALDDPQAGKALADSFEKAFKHLPENGGGRFGTFGYMMSYFGSRVALGAKNHPTLSVATYWKILAAASFATKDQNPPFEVILFSGDIAGLEEFMRVKTAKQAAKNMRARSFYVQMLSQVLARSILREFELPLCNLLFEGASRFLQMLPSDEVNKDKLKNLLVELNHRGLILHQGELAPQFADKPIQLDELSSFQLDKFGKTAFQRRIGKELFKASHVAGQQRFKILADQKDGSLVKFFEPFGGETSESNRCAWCGAEPPEKDSRFQRDEDGKKRCPQCGHFGWPMKYDKGDVDGLAKQLACARYVCLHDLLAAENKHSLKEQWPLPPECFKNNYSNWQLDVKANFPTWQECMNSFGYDYIIVTDKDEFFPPAKSECLALNPGWHDLPVPLWSRINEFPATIFGWRWVGHATPFDEDKQDVRDNEDLARDALVPEDSGYCGSKLVGILRVDGDAMGNLFKSCPTLYHYLALSEAVALFFEGRMNRLCEHHEIEARFIRDDIPPQAKRAYLLYAGGDDVLIFGSWHILPVLAEIIRDDHSRYVTHGGFDEKLSSPLNPVLSISASIVLEHDKFPVYQMARVAYDGVRDAKHFWLGRWTTDIRRAQAPALPEKCDQDTEMDSSPHAYEIEIAGEKYQASGLSFLGKTLPWLVFKKVVKLKEEIEEIFTNGASRALIQHLLAIESAFERDWQRLIGFEEKLRKQSGETRPAKKLQPLNVAEALAKLEHSPTGYKVGDFHKRQIFSVDTMKALQDEVRLISGEWQWLTAYSMLRYAKMQKLKSEDQQRRVQQGVMQLRDHLLRIEQVFHPLSYLGLAARWVELLTKKRSAEYGKRNEESGGQ